MKKTIVFLMVVVLFIGTAFAEVDLKSMTNDELQTLITDAQAELDSRSNGTNGETQLYYPARDQYTSANSSSTSVNQSVGHNEGIFSFRNGISWGIPQKQVESKENALGESKTSQNNASSQTLMYYNQMLINKYPASLCYRFYDDNLYAACYYLNIDSSMAYDMMQAQLSQALSGKYGDYQTMSPYEYCNWWQDVTNTKTVTPDSISMCRVWEYRDADIILVRIKLSFTDDRLHLIYRNANFDYSVIFPSDIDTSGI